MDTIQGQARQFCGWESERLPGTRWGHRAVCSGIRMLVTHILVCDVSASLTLLLYVHNSSSKLMLKMKISVGTLASNLQ